MTLIVGQSKSTQTGGSTAVASGLGEGQRLLSRAKRGWVWNQMFVLEEFSGPDPILVGRVSAVIVSIILSFAYRVQTLIRPFECSIHFFFFPWAAGGFWLSRGKQRYGDDREWGAGVGLGDHKMRLVIIKLPSNNGCNIFCCVGCPWNPRQCKAVTQWFYYFFQSPTKYKHKTNVFLFWVFFTYANFILERCDLWVMQNTEKRACVLVTVINSVSSPAL